MALPKIVAEEMRRRENWDFRWITKRGAHAGEMLQRCFYFEIGRHVPTFLEKIAARRSLRQIKNGEVLTIAMEDAKFTDNPPGSLGLSVLASVFGTFGQFQTRSSGFIVKVPLEYPSISFETFYKRTKTQSLTGDESASAEWFEMLAPMNAYSAWKHLNLMMESIGKIEDSEEPDILKRCGEMVLLRVPNDVTDTALLNAFKRFLKSEFRARSNPQKRSGKDLHAEFKGRLNQLGAWRLLKSGFSLEEAKNYSQKESGRSIYENNSEWSKAKRAIQSILRTRFGV